MTKNIFEEESTSETESSGGDAKIRKQARQLAYDVRYKVKQSLSKGEESNDASLKRAYLQQLNSSPAPGAVKRVAKKMLVGESYDFVDITETAKESVDKILNSVFVKKTELEDADGNSAFEVTDFVFGEEKSDREKKYKVRVTGKKGKKTYVRMADRKDIDKLRKGDEVSSVEMTGYGVPNEEKGKKKVVKKAKKDFDGDGKLESPEAEYKGSKDKAIKKAVAKEEVVQEADSLAAQQARWEANRQRRMKRSGSYERPNWIPRDQDHEDRYGSSKGVKKKPQKKNANLQNEDIADILARLEKKRISKGGDPDASPLGKKTGRAMKAKQDAARKKAGVKTEELELEGYYDSAVAASKAASKSNKPKVSLKDRIKSVAKKAIASTSEVAGKAVKVKSEIQAAPDKAKKKVKSYADRVKGIAKAGYKSGRGPVKTTSYRGAGVGRKEKIGEDFVTEVIKDDNPDANLKKIDVMKGKNKVKINPNIGEQIETDVKNAKDDQKSKQATMLKKRVLMQKLKAVRSGAGDSITASHMPEGEVVEGVIDVVKKGAKRHAKAVEAKKIKNRKAVPYAALGASYQPEGEVVEAAGCETKKIENKGKKTVDPEKNPVVEAKVDAGKSPETKEKDRNVRKFGVSHNVAGHGKLRRSLHRMNRGDKKIKGDKSAWTEMESVQVEAKQEQGRSDYGKASVRNKRAFGIEGEPEAISGSKERGKMIDARRYRHRTKRGIKKGDYKIDESHATAKKPSERAAIAKLEAILKRKEDLKKQTKGVKEEVVTELNRYGKETGKATGSINKRAGTPVKKGGSTDDKALTFVRNMIRKETGRPEGQRKKAKGEKGRFQYGDRKGTPADTIAKRREASKDAEKLMRDTRGT